MAPRWNGACWELVPVVAGFTPRESWGQRLSHVLDPEEAARLVAIRPTSVSEATWVLIRDVVFEALMRVEPKSAGSARKCVRALMPFAAWAFEQGHGGELEAFYTPELVETWREVMASKAARGDGPISKNSVVDYTARLRQMGPKVTPEANWPPRVGKIPGGAKRHLREPYSDFEVHQWVEMVRTAPSGDRRRIAETALALGFGAGLAPGEYPLIRAGMVRCIENGVWLDVPGVSARCVPVAQPWDYLLRRMRTQHDCDEVLFPTGRGKSAVSERFSRLQVRVDGAFMSAQRMRTTWLVHRLRAGVDARVLMRWAGLRTVSSMVDLLQYLPEVAPEDSLPAMRSAVVVTASW